ncbi:putative inactive histone-lysine N-methyltransferase SUVR2 [Bienertia sinuspersici]
MQPDGQGSGAPKSVDGIDKGLRTLASSSAKENHILDGGVSKRTPANIDIAASPLGEVKLSLSCNSDLEGKYFDSHDVQAVLKKVNDNCFHKYKIMDPKFSLLRVMEEFCEYVGKDTVDGVDQEKSNQQGAEVIDKSGICCLQSNGSIIAGGSDNVAATTDVAETNASISSSASKCAPVNMQSDKSTSDYHYVERDSSAADLNMKSLVVSLSDTSDITRGIEAVKVSLDKSNYDSPPLFHYIPQNVISHNADLVFSLAQIGDQDCCHSCCGDCLASSACCKCAQGSGGESPYTSEGLVRENFLDKCISMVRKPEKDYLVYCKECPLERLKNEDMLDPCKGHLKRTFIKECWTKCGCNKDCGNRVVQHGISHNLQVFWTPEGKGWGLRTLEDLPKGAFVCEYIGEILTCTELHKRSMKRSNDKHSYSVLLDTDWGSKPFKEAEFLCLDAAVYGNIARFINHRCSDANLIEIPVEVETPSHHYYHVALFTTRKVDAFEELTWVCIM